MAPSLLRRSSGNQTGVEAELPLMHLNQDGVWREQDSSVKWSSEEETMKGTVWSTVDNLPRRVRLIKRELKQSSLRRQALIRNGDAAELHRAC